MLFENSDFKISSVDYQIIYDSGQKIATITPVIVAVCTKNQLLIASIRVDGHELRPSLKLFLEEGKHSYVIPYVKIANPLLTNPEDEPGSKDYKVTLRLHFSGEESHDLDDHIKVMAP